MILNCEHNDEPRQGHSVPEQGRVCCYCYEQFVRKHFQISELTMNSIKRWIEDGIHPGGFLMNVLRDAPVSLVVGVADEINRIVIGKIVHYLINQAPRDCWGNREKVEAWAAHEGQNGLNRYI